MNKKAVSVVMVIVEILVVLIVAWMTTAVATEMGKSERVRKVNLANDLVMMVDTLVGVPGEAVVEFPRNVSKYTFIMGQGQVVVFQKGDPVVNRAVRQLILPRGVTVVGSLEEKEHLCLEKRKWTITLRECNEQERAV